VKQFWIFDFGFSIGRSRNKIAFGLALAALLFALCSSAQAQQPKKVWRIGYLSSIDPAFESTRAEGIRLALRTLGYIEGQNIATEYRYADGKRDRLPEILAELLRLKIDILVVAGGIGPVRAAIQATKTIPIVMTGGGADPVEAGFIESLARPGGNVTGITNINQELGGKRLELLKEAVPRLTRVAVLYDPATELNVREVKEFLPAAARALKLTIQPLEARDINALEKVFAGDGKQRPDGIYVIRAGPLMRANEKRIAGFAAERRLPSIYATRQAVDSGGLMSYGADSAEIYRQVAWYVDKILKGANPADLPVEQPKKFELVINMKTAKQIGVTIPSDLLARATKIIR